jgi:predicted transposase YdaD
MPMPFDATLKGLLERSPDAWPVLAGLPQAPATVIDADVSTVTAASDKVLRVAGPEEYLLDVNFQRGPDASLPRRVHLYNTLLDTRHGLPVISLVVLLTPRAHLSSINGVYERSSPGQELYLRFHYRVLRLWLTPAETLLNGGLGTLPLAPLGSVTEDELPGVLERMRERLQPVGDRGTIEDVWTATYVLMGLRYEQSLVDHLLQGVLGMEESVTYMAIIEKGEARGRLQEARRLILLHGQKRFGPPDDATRAALDAITDIERLEQLHLRVHDVNGWQELLT